VRDRHLSQGGRSAGPDARLAAMNINVHYYNDESEVDRFVRAVAG
jgi:hypothetical protein